MPVHVPGSTRGSSLATPPGMPVRHHRGGSGTRCAFPPAPNPTLCPHVPSHWHALMGRETEESFIYNKRLSLRASDVLACVCARARVWREGGREEERGGGEGRGRESGRGREGESHWRARVREKQRKSVKH